MSKNQLLVDYNTFHSKSAALRKIPDKKNFTYRLLIDFLKNNLFNMKAFQGKSILDLGCGVGSVSLYLAHSGYDVTGIDISINAINAARKAQKNLNIKNVKFILGDVSKKKFNKKFDVVILSEVIEHIKDDSALLRNVYKILNKNGLMIITTPSKSAPLYRLGVLGNFDRRVGHLRRYNRTELVELISKSVFVVNVFESKEGILRNFLFTFNMGNLLLKIANRISVLGDFISILDNILLKIAGGSNYYILAKKN